MSRPRSTPAFNPTRLAIASATNVTITSAAASRVAIETLLGRRLRRAAVSPSAGPLPLTTGRLPNREWSVAYDVGRRRRRSEQHRHEDAERQRAPVAHGDAEIAEEEHEQPGRRERGEQEDDGAGEQCLDHGGSSSFGLPSIGSSVDECSDCVSVLPCSSWPSSSEACSSGSWPSCCWVGGPSRSTGRWRSWRASSARSWVVCCSACLPATAWRSSPAGSSGPSSVR